MRGRQLKHNTPVLRARLACSLDMRRLLGLGTNCWLQYHDMKPKKPETLTSTLHSHPQETDRELILRFFAMAGHMADYRMPLSSFLNDEADRGIQLDAAALKQRAELFKKALQNVRQPHPASLIL